jgi:hypothetical protein
MEGVGFIIPDFYLGVSPARYQVTTASGLNIARENIAMVWPIEGLLQQV